MNLMSGIKKWILPLCLCLGLCLCACSAESAANLADAAADAASEAARAAASSTSEPEPEPEPEPPPVPDTVFVPLSPLREEALSEALAWAEEESARLKALEEPDHALYAEAFAEANADYKSGFYILAEEGYREILAENPFHPGALNNLVLCLLQLEDHEEALRYSLLSGVLHPDFLGGRVNLTVALHALGYEQQQAYDAIAGAEIGYPDFAAFIQGIAESGEAPEKHPLFQSYMYNSVYSNMERELRESADPEQRERDDLRLAAGEVTEEELAAEHLAGWMDAWEESLEELKAEHPEDSDYPALLEYLRGLRKLREARA